jgi:hypothetical protein
MQRQNRWAHGLENLENRVLFSVLNVGSFGAVAGDGRDDSGAVIAAVRAGRAGDTLQFGAGQYDFNSRVEIRYGVTIQGAGRGSTTIRARDGIHSFYFRNSGLRVNDITFDGGAFFLDRGDGVAMDDIRINNSDFVHFNRGSDIGTGSGAIGAPGYTVNNLSITNCSFRDSAGAMGMYIHKGDNWNITDNEFITTAGGIKSNNHGETVHNIRIQRNYWSNTSRMGVELQGQVDGFWFEDNYYENPVLSSNYNDNLSTIAWSVIYHGNQTRDQHLRRNTVKAPQRPDGTGVRQAFEAGNNAEIVDNYINGIGTVYSAYMGDSSGTSIGSAIGRTTFANNKLIDVKWGYGKGYGPFGGNVDQYNNGPNVNVSWDINRARPGPNRGGAPTPNPSPSPTPTPSPTPDPTPAPGGTYLSDLNWVSANNAWGQVEKDRSNGEQGSNDGRTLTIAGKTYSKGLGVHSNSEVVYDLAGRYSTFLSDIGLDAETGNNGSVAFQVFADGTKIYDSGVMRGNNAAKSLQVDVRNVRQLKLVATNGGDNNYWDHADWANARLT